ncbi:MAG TPA: hypothetical protein VGQ72_04255 [Pyrinomonadaceae bacterium]|nr:hypothetical protein [Pyrinomonadaceae bacterium]
MKKLWMKKRVACVLAIFALLALETTAPGKLAANKLAANRLRPYSAAANSAAASKLAASPIAAGQIGPNRYAANPEATHDFMATSEGREVLSFIVSCALPADATLIGTLPDGSAFEFFGDIGLANEWLDHPLRKAGRGWVSACLFARVNANSVAEPLSMRGQTQALATTPEEQATWSLEEGAFYGDYFVAPGEPVQWIACRGKDQAAGETGGLVLRDCTEPDPNDPSHTLCGFTYAGDCSALAAVPACEHFSPLGYYRDCHDQPGDESRSDVFRQVITVYVLP